MPIRLNLLAEQQEAEDLRRRDPVKRAAYLCGAIVVGVLLWIGSLQLNLINASAEARRLTAEWNAIEPDFKTVSTKQADLLQIDGKLLSLDKLARNRFIWASALNALQSVRVDQIRLVRVETDQSYTFAEATKPRTNTVQRGGQTVQTVTRGKPATSTEKIVLRLDGHDYSGPTGNQVNRYREALAAHEFFRTRLESPQQIKLTYLSGPSPDPVNPDRSYKSFTLECQFPETTREP